MGVYDDKGWQQTASGGWRPPSHRNYVAPTASATTVPTYTQETAPLGSGLVGLPVGGGSNMNAAQALEQHMKEAQSNPNTAANAWETQDMFNFIGGGDWSTPEQKQNFANQAKDIGYTVDSPAIPVAKTPVVKEETPPPQQFDMDAIMASLIKMLQPILDSQNNQMSQFMKTQTNQSNQFSNQFNDWLKAQQETAAAQEQQQTQQQTKQQQQTAYNQNQQSGLNQQGSLMGGGATSHYPTFDESDKSRATLGIADNESNAGIANARSRYLRDIWADKV